MLYLENCCLVLIDCGDFCDVGDFFLMGVNVEFFDFFIFVVLFWDVCVLDMIYIFVFLGYRV